MRKLISVFALIFMSFAALAGTQYSTSETDIGTLMGDPRAHAILEKYLPETISNPQFSMAHGFTLVFIQSFDQTGELTEENLAKIDAEFAEITDKE